ncbi:MAG: hypothetical protein U0802_20915 [Candidatus Binatia bacterium]
MICGVGIATAGVVACVVSCCAPGVMFIAAVAVAVAMGMALVGVGSSRAGGLSTTAPKISEKCSAT